MIKVRTLFFALLQVILLVFLQPHSAHAQEVNLSISPPLLRIIAKPGSELTEKFVVSNLGDIQTFVTHVYPFSPAGYVGEITVDRESSGPIRFDIENEDIVLGDPFLLEQRKGKEIVMKIRIPDGLEDGDYYYVFETTHETGRVPEGSVTISHKIHVYSLILVSVTRDGNLETSASAGEISIGEKSENAFPIRIQVNNHGRHAFQVDGYITIDGMGLHKNIPITGEYVLANSSKQLTLSTGNLLQGLFLGKYTVTAQINAGGEPVVKKTSFTSFPAEIVSLVILIPAIIGGALVILKKYPL